MNYDTQKYAAARSAAVITLKTGETLIVWLGEALLTPKVDYVVLARGEFDPEHCVYVSWERAVQDLSGVVEEIEQTPAKYFFGAVDTNESRWHRLVDSGASLDQLAPSELRHTAAPRN